MTTESIETLIFNKLIHDENYTRTVLPFIKNEYFHDQAQKIVFELINDYFTKYNQCASLSSLKIEADQKNLSEDLWESCKSILESLDKTIDVDNVWLTEQTEKFCQDKAIYNAIMQSIQIIDNKTKLDKGAIPQILQDALGVSFDKSIGHDFLEDYEKRYEFYHQEIEKVPFDIKYLNTITRGGLARKSLSCILASTGVGKTMMMCHMAANNLMDGRNVLYITLEMAEERISERIDANLLNVYLNELDTLPKEVYESKMNRLIKKTTGKLIVKEYPTATVNAGHFRHLLNELKTKKKFEPDIIYIDYLNLCTSSRVKMGASINTYVLIKSIAEELRGLAVEFNLPIMTATQSNRDGASNSDIDLTNTSECIFVDEMITLKDGTKKKIGDVDVGDQITSNDDYKTVVLVHHKKIKSCHKITLKSGKSIVVSEDHVFPTSRGRLSIKDGLDVGDLLKAT
jgi:replicative DNA helicase